MVSRGVCVWTRGQSYEEVSDDVGILQIALMESTIRNITVINVAFDGADKQALDGNPLCILLIALCDYNCCLIASSMSLPRSCLFSGQLWHNLPHKPHLHAHTHR